MTIRFHSLRAAACAFSCVVLLAEESTPAQSGELRYGGAVGREFAYDIEIVVDAPGAVVTYKGVTKYIVDATNAEQMSLTYRGGLTESNKGKGTSRPDEIPGVPGPPGAPRPPFSGIPRPPRFPGAPGMPAGLFGEVNFAGKQPTTNRFTMTTRGQVLSMEGSSQLPFALGNVSLLPFEALPTAGEKEWTIESGTTVTEKNDDGGTARSRFGPFANQPERVQAGQITTQYAIVKQTESTVAVKKTYRLTTPRAGDNAAIDVAGTGIWTFDPAERMPQSLDYEQKLVVQTDTVTITFPTTIRFTRMSSADLTKMAADEKRRRDDAIREHSERMKALPPAELSRLYREGQEVPDSEIPIPAGLPVPKGLIIAFKWGGGGGWHGGEVVENLADGQIKYQEIGWSRKVYTSPRNELRLAPREVAQPNVKKGLLDGVYAPANSSPKTPAAVLREWTDNTGVRKIKATYLSSSGDTVRIRRDDGKEMDVPLSRFSKADQDYARSQEKSAGNDPFEP